MQAPVGSQSVAPQVALVIEQAVVQQLLPVPLMPQSPVRQASLVVQAPVACCAWQVPPLQ
jgi:hypothetical protein